MNLLVELQQNAKLVYNATEAGDLLGLDPRTVRRACESGQIPSFKVGRLRMISKETLLRLLSDQVA